MFPFFSGQNIEQYFRKRENPTGCLTCEKVLDLIGITKMQVHLHTHPRKPAQVEEARGRGRRPTEERRTYLTHPLLQIWSHWNSLIQFQQEYKLAQPL